MPITIVSASKQIEALLDAPPGTGIKGLQPNEAKKIRRQLAVLAQANSMLDIKSAHPEWRVHRYQGATRTWSFDVGGPTRLLMEWDEVRKEVSDVRFDNPH